MNLTIENSLHDHKKPPKEAENKQIVCNQWQNVFTVCINKCMGTRIVEPWSLSIHQWHLLLHACMLYTTRRVWSCRVNVPDTGLAYMLVGHIIISYNCFIHFFFLFFQIRQHFPKLEQICHYVIMTSLCSTQERSSAVHAGIWYNKAHTWLKEKNSDLHYVSHSSI